MGRQRIYESGLYNQYVELVSKFQSQEKLLKETNKLVKSLNETIESLNEANKKLIRDNEELKKEILRLKSKNDKEIYTRFD